MKVLTIGLLGILFLCSFVSSLPSVKFQDNRDGTSYHAVAIGHTHTMSTNLKFNDEHAYNYQALERYGNHYGKLYTYASISDDNGQINNNICPEGWRLPDLSDWEYLITGMNPVVSRTADGELTYHIPENYAKLQFGGFRSHLGADYFNLGKEGHYLSTTGNADSWTTIIVTRNGTGYDININKNTAPKRAVSCRCVKDSE